MKLAWILLLILVSSCATPEAVKTQQPVELESQEWVGTVAFHENTARPGCAYTGTMKLRIVDTSVVYMLAIENVTEYPHKSSPCYKRAVFPEKKLSAIIDNSSIKFTDVIMEFQGSITNQEIRLEFASCPEQKCLDGVTAIGIVGEGVLTKQ